MPKIHVYQKLQKLEDIYFQILQETPDEVIESEAKKEVNSDEILISTRSIIQNAILSSKKNRSKIAKIKVEDEYLPVTRINMKSVLKNDSSLDNISNVDSSILTNKSLKESDNHELKLGFGLLVKYMRTKLELSEEGLAERMDVDVNDIISIESNMEYEPEPRIIHQFAKFFQIPIKNLMQASGLTIMKNQQIFDETIKFAASSDPSVRLTNEESMLLDAFVSILSKQE